MLNIGKLPEPVRNCFLQILAGIEYCNINLVAHKDLKPENKNILIVKNYIVKIEDFGWSNLVNDGKYLKKSCGSLNYASPEVMTNRIVVQMQMYGIVELFYMLIGRISLEISLIIPHHLMKIQLNHYLGK